MAKQPAQPPVPPAPHEQFDELTGVYGFFRRNQKLLLYTAGLFTLLTFSITGPMSSMVTTLFSTPKPSPTIEVDGARVEVNAEDYTYGMQIAKNLGFQSAIPFGVCPQLSAGEEGRSDLGEVLAILRRAAISEGIQVSMAEVDKAIEAQRDHYKAETPTKLARSLGFNSLAHYRSLMAEAMRIGTYVRLQTLVFGGTDAEVLKNALEDREKITLKVAAFDEKALEKQLKESTTLTDEDLNKWLDGKSEPEKVKLQIYDVPLMQLQFAGLLTDAGQFDPEQWKDEALKDFVLTDDQLKGYYEQQKEARFKNADGTFKPVDDADVKAAVTRTAQAEQVMNNLMAKLRTQLDQTLSPLNQAVATARTDFGAADAKMREIVAKVGAAEADLAAKERELEPKPDDATLKAAVETAKAALQAAKDEQLVAEQEQPIKKAAIKTAQEAVDAARAAFDFPAAMAKLLEGKSGAVQKAMPALKTAEQMKDLDADDLGLGTWTDVAKQSRVANKGDLSSGPCRTTKAVLLFQAMAVDAKPLKPWETRKPLLEGAYFTELAQKQGLEKKKLMEDALLRLAKERMPEKVTEIEGTRQKRIDDKLAEWEKKTKDAIAEAEAELAKPGIGKLARTSWQRKLDSENAELARKDMRKTGFEAEIGRQVDSEIAEEARKHYGDVIDAAAAEAGFTVTTLDPLPRDLQQQPRFDKDYDPTVVYLFRNQSKLKVGEATALLQDFADRRWIVACCTKVEPMTAADITRREFEAKRSGAGLDYASDQAARSYQQAFTLKALVARYQLQRPNGEQQDLAGGPAK